MLKTTTFFDFDATLARLSLNQRQFAELLDVSASAVKTWRKERAIPLEHYHVALAITPEMAESVRDWVAYDLADLRRALGYTQDDMAGELHSSTARIAAWEKRGQIPRDRLTRALQLAHKTMNRGATRRSMM